MKTSAQTNQAIASQVLADYTHYSEVYKELELLLQKDFGLYVARFHGQWRVKDMDTQIEALLDDGSDWTLSEVIQYGINKRKAENENISAE